MDYTIRGILPARILELVAVPFSRGFTNQGIQLGSPALQVASLPTALSGKPSKIRSSVQINGEGNGNPLQYSCLENPMDGGTGKLQSMGSLRVGHN